MHGAIREKLNIAIAIWKIMNIFLGAPIIFSVTEVPPFKLSGGQYGSAFRDVWHE